MSAAAAARKILFLLGSTLPLLASPFGWNAAYSRKVEVTGTVPCRLTLKQTSEGMVQVMHLHDAVPVVETLRAAGDEVEISRAAGDSWWIGFQADNQGQQPTSPNPGIDLDLELSVHGQPGGAVVLPFHVSAQMTEPRVLVKVHHASQFSRLLSGKTCTFIKAPFSVVDRTQEDDVMIRIGN